MWLLRSLWDKHINSQQKQNGGKKLKKKKERKPKREWHGETMIKLTSRHPDPSCVDSISLICRRHDADVAGVDVASTTFVPISEAAIISDGSLIGWEKIILLVFSQSAFAAAAAPQMILRWDFLHFYNWVCVHSRA